MVAAHLGQPRRLPNIRLEDELKSSSGVASLLSPMRPTLAFLILFAIAALTPAAFADDKGICAVCGPREGAGLEPIAARATLGGREFVFCSLECKIEFLKDPASFT